MVTMINKNNINKIVNNKNIKIYIDGSYSLLTKEYSYGMVVVDSNLNILIYKKNGKGKNINAANLRNVAGEMKGAMEAVSYCKKNNIKNVEIYYDYLGIEFWITGKWKRKNIFTEKYYKYMINNMKNIKIYFNKIKSHSGNKWNDYADYLAKQALKKNK